MANIYGQPPHFDNSTPNFARIGSVLDISNSQTPNNFITTIPFGAVVGNKRNRRQCLRRHIYQYVNDSFVFYETRKGVRQKFGGISSVADLADLNSRSAIHAALTTETAPTYISQELLRSLFAIPSNNSYFFVEGAIARSNDTGSSGSGLRPQWFSIYRYGKIKNGVIIVCKETTEVITRNKT